VAIIIHQAICGEQNKAWDLLGTTLTDIGVAKKIAFKTDLQDSPPSGVPWLPVIRGFLFNEYFLLIKTYTDTSPDVRKGRVFSHCLIISKEDLPKINDLTELISVFKNEIDKSILLETITLIPKIECKVVLKPALQMRFNKSIQGFTSFLNNDGSVIWIGQKHYEIAVSKFWQLLSPLQKELFNFGINFNPSEIPKKKINFIVTPENQEAKFEGKGFCIVKTNDSVTLTEFAEQFLAGEENATTRLAAFAEVIEVDISSLTTREISLFAKGVSTFENLNSITDIKLLNTLSNIVAKYSPEEKKGSAFKNRLIVKMCAVVESTGESDVLSLKTFQTNVFKDSQKKIIHTTKKWIDDYLLSEKENEKKDFTPTLTQIYDSTSKNWLTDLARDRVKNFLSSINQTSANIVWKWISNDTAILKIISSEIDYSKKAEGFFISSFSLTTDKSILKEAKAFAVNKDWLKFHASIVKSEYDFKTAIAEQLKVDSDANYFDGIETITSGVNPKEIIDVAVSNGDKRIISISGKLCKSDAKLLETIEIENYNWQGILVASVKSGNKVTSGIKEPQKVFHKLFDALLEGKSVNENLLEEISKTDFANILTYPQRNKIWTKFSTHLKSKFLEKTAGALLQSVSENSTFQIPTDKELSDYIISNGISTFLYYNRNNIKTTLPIFNTYTQMSEQTLNVYINNYSGILDVVDATQLGKLVRTRNFRNVANSIYQKTFHNKQFKVALAECQYLLDFITRGFAWGFGAISNIEFSKDEWWTAFSSLSYRLYSGGPTENKVWTEADGKEYDLQTRGTGKEVWIAALRKLRKDECTSITVKKLLKAMLKDFPKNDELKTLKDLSSKL
jgi:hypothetical protein